MNPTVQFVRNATRALPSQSQSTLVLSDRWIMDSFPQIVARVMLGLSVAQSDCNFGVCYCPDAVVTYIARISCRAR